MAQVDGRYSLVDAERKEEKATLEVLKGRGFVLTFSSHFAVAVIVGVLGFLWHQSKGEVSSSMSTELHQVSQDLAALRSDFNQFKAEQSMRSIQTESAINDLKISVGPRHEYPSQPSDPQLSFQRRF